MTQPTNQPVVSLLPPRVAQAVVRIFDGMGSREDGQLFEAWMTELAMSLSIVSDGAVFHDATTTAFFEGQRGLAIKVLGARADMARLTATKAQQEEQTT